VQRDFDAALCGLQGDVALALVVWQHLADGDLVEPQDKVVEVHEEDSVVLVLLARD